MKTYRIRFNGQLYELEVEEINTGAKLEVHGQKPAETAPVQVVPAKAATAQTASTQTPSTKAALPAQTATPAQISDRRDTGAVGGRKVLAPMPGTILQVHVQVGDSVKAGQVLVILEAMKMENEIVAPANGTVSAVQVSKGAQVGAGDLLISLN